MAAGRKYLFDIGTGVWSTGSIKWFNAVYGARNVEFDEIFGEHGIYACIRSRMKLLCHKVLPLVTMAVLAQAGK